MTVVTRHTDPSVVPEWTRSDPLELAVAAADADAARGCPRLPAGPTPAGALPPTTPTDGPADGVVIRDDAVAAVPVPRAADPRRIRVRAMAAHVERLEAELATERRRRQAVVDRYEHLLERQTAAYRSWVADGDRGDDSFLWVGRRTPGPAGRAEARDGEAGGADGDDGLLDRVHEWVADHLVPG